MSRATALFTVGDSPDARRDDRRAGGTERMIRQRIGQALRFHQQGEYGRAIRIYRWYLARDPDNARVLQIHGLALRQIGDLDGAIRMLSRSVAIDPEDSPTQNSLGNAYYEQGRLEDALLCFTLAIDADPVSANAHNDQGNVLRDMGRTTEAIESYRNAIAIDGTLATPHFNLGNALWDTDSVDEAIACYQAAVTIDPGYAAAHNNLGNAYRTMSDLARAVRSYAAAAACEQGFALAHFNLANALKDLGRNAEALAEYNEVLTLEPDNALAGHMVAALSGGSATEAPRAFVRQVFDTYAGHFDTHLGTVLEYRLPEVLRDAVMNPTATSEPGDRGAIGRALDLGCGTGLVAEAFAGAVGYFDGVDLSPRMLVEARRKDLYDTLVEDDLVSHLRHLAGREPAYDAILAADSFNYIGDLAPVFAGVSGCLVANGVFGFSAEITDVEPFELRPTGRFAHSESYVRDLAGAHGFTLSTTVPTVIRLENNRPVNGAVFVLINARSPTWGTHLVADVEAPAG